MKSSLENTENSGGGGGGTEHGNQWEIANLLDIACFLGGADIRKRCDQYFVAVISVRIRVIEWRSLDNIR